MMKRLSQYAAVGAVATACHYALLVGLVEWAAAPAGWSAMAGSAFGALVAYGGNRLYTFSSHLSVRHQRALPRFAVTATLGALLNALLVGGGTSLGVHYLLAQLVATALVMLATFHLNRTWTFASKD